MNWWIDNEWCLRPKCMIETSNWSKSWSYCLTIQVSKHRFCGRLRKGASITVSLLRFSSVCLFIDPLLRLSGKPASKLAGIDNSKLKIEGQEVFNKSSTEPSRCTFKPHIFSRFFVPTLCWSEKVLLFRKQWFQNADSIQISDVPQVCTKKPPKPGLQTKRCWCWYWLVLLGLLIFYIQGSKKVLSNWVTNIQQQVHWIHRSLWHAFPAILQARCSMIFWSDTFIRISLKLPPEGRFFQDAAAATGSWNERQPARKLHNMHTCANDHTYTVYLSWNTPYIIQHPGS